MNLYHIFQITLDDATVDLINSEGWTSSNRASAYSRATVFGDPTDGLKHDCYDKVAEVLGDSLDDVFRIGNIGPEHPDEDITVGNDGMRSISVGDIIADDHGSRWVVATFGFTPITAFTANQMHQAQDRYHSA